MLFGSEHRRWACSQATGETPEVAIGTGLNLPYYPSDVKLTGIDISSEMLAAARIRATELKIPAELEEGDAQDLPFPDATFDTVISTYAMCSIPDEVHTISEMKRVLREGGRLILVDHIRSSVKPIFWLQRLLELRPKRDKGELTRRPLLHVQAAGFEIQASDRLRAGIIERLVALKPGS